MNDCSVCLSFDFDALSPWLYRNQTTPTPLSRGEFGARVGVGRILDLLEEHGIRATFFIPGHTCESFPEQTRRIAGAGHEIAHHGYCHEVPAALSYEDEVTVMEKGIAAIRAVCGHAPAGYRSPSWDLSPNSVAMLLQYGFQYDSSLMGDDFTPYLCRSGDEGDTTGPFRFGKPIDLVELPVSWIMDDFPIFEWNPTRSYGLAPPSHAEETWREEFEFMYERVPGGAYTLTMHPQVSGRGSRIRLLDRLIRHMRGRSGVRFTTMQEVAAAVRPRLLAEAAIRSDDARGEETNARI